MNLYKGTFSGWKEFLFVENKNFFYYYKSEKDETPSGWMNLTGAKGKKKKFSNKISSHQHHKHFQN
jgi:hypothetical protein